MSVRSHILKTDNVMDFLCLSPLEKLTDTFRIHHEQKTNLLHKKQISIFRYNTYPVHSLHMSGTLFPDHEV